MVGGVRRKLHFFCIDLPHSDAPFVKAYPAETTEAFLDGHVSAFGFFGGVPLSILYDNTTIAVAKICGDGRRERTRAFTELQSHYLFRDRFGRPGEGERQRQGRGAGEVCPVELPDADPAGGELRGATVTAVSRVSRLHPSAGLRGEQSTR